MINKNLNIGFEIDDFSKLKETSYYIDKTLFIKEYFYDFSEVILITRPKRFGKTINLSMIENFIDITKDSTNLFKDTLIYKEQDIVEKYMNKYPVIKLNFKDLIGNNFEDFKTNFAIKNCELFSKYDFILNSELVGEYSKKDYKLILNQTTNMAEQKHSLTLLTKILYEYYKVRPMVLIDEYDYPFDQAFENGYSSEIRSFMMGYLSNALKGNTYLEKALMVGCKYVSLTTLFSGLNNIRVFSLNDRKYNQHFGFTEDEVKKALEEVNLLTFEEVKYWYGGYNVDGITIYNPWSILNYLDKKEFKVYYSNTNSDYIFKSLLRKMPNFYYYFCILIQGRSIIEDYNYEITHVSDLDYNNLAKSYLINLLFVNGYLTIVNHLDIYEKEFKIVNNEIKCAISDILSKKYNEDVKDISYSNDFIKEFLNFNFKEVEKTLNKIIPVCETYDERFFSGLMYYMIYISKDIINNEIVVTSNGESGFLIRCKDYSNLFIIQLEKSNDYSVEELADRAFWHIGYNKYDDDLKDFKYIHKVAIVIHDGNAYLKLLDNKDYDYENKYKGIEEFLYEGK